MTKKLGELLERLEYRIKDNTGAALDTPVTAVINDSRLVCRDCLFICIQGANRDSHDLAAEAVEKGAKVIVVSHDVVLGDDRKAILV